MALTAIDYQFMLLDEVGQGSNVLLASWLPRLWASYADKALTAPRLQYLYTKRAVLDLLMGKYAQRPDFEGGQLKTKDSQQFQAYKVMRENVQASIKTDLARYRSTRVPGVALLTQVSPYLSPAGSTPDPNDSTYKGDPTKRLSYRP